MAYSSSIRVGCDFTDFAIATAFSSIVGNVLQSSKISLAQSLKGPRLPVLPQARLTERAS